MRQGGTPAVAAEVPAAAVVPVAMAMTVPA